MKKKLFLCLAVVAMVSFLWSCQVEAVPVTLTWGANTEEDLAGYEIHYGESAGNYIVSIVMPKTFTAYTIGGLEEGKTYYFALKAFDTSGNLSVFSDEASWLVPIPDTDAPAPPTVINIPAGSSVNININQ